ncbi:response regulator [Caulobacter mirabilis]|uniref:histidine kinase n=1 Tax=Caulobacter mirabilis TaxID=69666 RepID=A0A2D2B3A1_9CAUL|nr:response regulator [Caulobacter mirabilis]ATQ44711.1 hybrid sensor histidine kinase/response regulator [Caulobacter mirabilis]
MPEKARAITPEQLATLSHEFRTPLNGVLGMARLLEGTRLTAEQKAYVAALRESGDHLLSLVNDVLDLARLGEGRIELHPAPVEAADLLRQAAELMSTRTQEKGVEIAWAVAPGLPPVLADEGRLRQILLNFAGNAVKFTETGGVLLSAEAAPRRRMRLTVRDTGPGVPAAARARIFEPFVHADPAHGAAALGGAGLGLAIVRRLAEAMGGEVGVSDAPGGGAEFWFEAPFEAAGPAVRARPLARRVVGIASPNSILREGAARQVESLGGRAVVAADRDALIAAAPTDAVLLIDNALAGKRPLRAPEGRASIILLRPDERGRIAKARAAGFSGYLIKPLRSASLAARVLAAVGAEPAAAPSQDDDRAAAAAAPGARVLLAEDNPINALLARTLLQREGAQVDRAASGEEAVAALAAASYDLVLMDVRMPGMSGVDAALALRARGVKTPIIALTADAFEDDRRACLAAGMDDFLVKPLTESALRAVLTRWVGWTDAAGEAKVAS